MPIEMPENMERTFGEEKPRYYVMRIGGGPPRKPYGSRFMAESDAVKLANENPGAEFAVLKCKAVYRSNAIIGIGDDGIRDKIEQVPDGHLEGVRD